MIGRLRRWWTDRQEHAAVRRRPIADDLWKRTLIRYPFLRAETEPGAPALRRMTSLFLDRKEFNAIPPVRLTNDVVVAVAAQACLPVLRLGLSRYDGFVGIVLHPDQVVAPRQHLDEFGVMHEYQQALAGEAVEGGPVMLSWRDVRGSGRTAHEGYNVVIHEFAHVLDMADGRSDGIPPLPPDLSRAEWAAVLQREYDGFASRVEADEPTGLDPYGAEGPDEFFAVASEAFFVCPIRLLDEHAAMYALLARFYRTDPATAARR